MVFCVYLVSLILIICGGDSFPQQNQTQPDYLYFNSEWIFLMHKVIIKLLEKHLCWSSSSNLYKFRCLEEAKLSCVESNKVSILTVKRFSRRIVLQFLGINHMIWYASPALAAPIMPDMKEPELMRFVCLSLFYPSLILWNEKMLVYFDLWFTIFYVKHLGLWSYQVEWEFKVKNFKTSMLYSSSKMKHVCMREIVDSKTLWGFTLMNLILVWWKD